MMLALNTGMRVGVRHGWPMVVGELLGVALVATLSVAFVATIIHSNPEYFLYIKYAAALWLAYVAYTNITSHGDVQLHIKVQREHTKLAAQGFATAVGNPKGWAFTASFIPPFINPELALTSQLFSLIFVLLIGEFICLYLYMTGGLALGKWLRQRGMVDRMGLITGVILLGLALWLVIN